MHDIQQASYCLRPQPWCIEKVHSTLLEVRKGDENVVENQKKIYKNNKKIIRDPRIKIPKNKSYVVARIEE